MVRGDLSISEIMNKYLVPRSVLGRWKKQLLDQPGSPHEKSFI